MKKKWLAALAVPFLALNMSASNVSLFVHEELVIHSIKYFPFAPGDPQKLEVDVTFKEAITISFLALTYVGDESFETAPQGESLGFHPRNPGRRQLFTFLIPPERFASDGSGFVWLQMHGRSKLFLNLGAEQRVREAKTYRLEGNAFGHYVFQRKELYQTEEGGDLYRIVDYEKVRFEGMRPTFYASGDNSLPMANWRAYSNYVWGSKESFECDKATLHLLNDFDSFEIGYETMYERRLCRAFDLETVPGSDLPGSTTFQLAEETEVSPDGRYQKKKGEGGLFYRTSRDLYFPPLEGNVAKSYDFVLVLDGADLGGAAQYVYPFTYVKDRNFVGPCASSDFCVAEVK